MNYRDFAQENDIITIDNEDAPDWVKGFNFQVAHVTPEHIWLFRHTVDGVNDYSFGIIRIRNGGMTLFDTGLGA